MEDGISYITFQHDKVNQVLLDHTACKHSLLLCLKEYVVNKFQSAGSHDQDTQKHKVPSTVHALSSGT